MRRMGIWLGTIERTEGTSIGTERGVTKCRTVSRFPGNARWNGKLTLDMQGVPWEPVPGRAGHHIPVEIDRNGQAMDETEEHILHERQR